MTSVERKMSLKQSLFRKNKPEPAAVYSDVTDGLKTIYKTNLLPIEKEFYFNDIQSPELEDPDFDAKPLVMLVGQYSTGKTTFIRYLIDKEYPGSMIGPEPTTDRFEVISHGKEDNKVPGNVLAVDGTKQFGKLQKFGGAFLSRFEGIETDSDVLKSLTLLDTPGILAGEKQSVNRGYDFTQVLKWFAERADRILLLFDAHKLDISDEFKSAIDAIKGEGDKIRIILNKADMLKKQQQMRIYGALMWSLSKILNSPEVPRVYVGSFWSEPLQNDDNRELFEQEQDDLISDLKSLPRNATIRKMNDLIKRTRAVKVHAQVISHLRRNVPNIGKAAKKKEIIKNLEKYFAAIQSENNISPSDMPDVEQIRQQLERHDFSTFPILKKEQERAIDAILSEDITRVVKLLPNEATIGGTKVEGGIFDKDFMPVGRGVEFGRNEDGWIVERERAAYDETFQSLELTRGHLISGAVAKAELIKSKLPNAELGRIWRLADVDMDGFLDIDEFALAKYLVRIKLAGADLPQSLPNHLIPPSKVFKSRKNSRKPERLETSEEEDEGKEEEKEKVNEVNVEAEPATTNGHTPNGTSEAEE